MTVGQGYFQKQSDTKTEFSDASQKLNAKPIDPQEQANR
jgi:hypothetical protein